MQGNDLRPYAAQGFGGKSRGRAVARGADHTQGTGQFEIAAKVV